MVPTHGGRGTLRWVLSAVAAFALLATLPLPALAAHTTAPTVPTPVLSASTVNQGVTVSVAATATGPVRSRFHRGARRQRSMAVDEPGRRKRCELASQGIPPSSISALRRRLLPRMR
jgi:hypothetical protein